MCRRCGAKLEVVGYVCDSFTVRRVLDELGLGPPEEKPPPEARELVRVPVDDEGRELPAC